MTIWSLSKIIGIHNQTLYNWSKQYPIATDVVNHNGYRYYKKDNLITWLNNIGKHRLAMQI